MFERLGRIVIERRWWVIAAWIVAALVIVPGAPRLGDVTNSDESSFLPDSYESARADELGRTAFPDESGATALLVFTRSDGGALTSGDGATIARWVGAVEEAAIDRVGEVATGAAGQVSPDGTVRLALIRFEGTASEDAVLDAAAAVRSVTGQQLEGTGLEASLTGDAAIKLDDRDAHGTAEKTVGVATIALILLLLLALFRSPVAALLPIVSIALVFLIASSVIAFAADRIGFDVSPDLPPLLTVVLFGIGTDYILFTLFRYREHLRDGLRGHDAIVSAAGRVGEVITFAALVVVVAFSALALSELGSLRTMAPGLVIGVALMWLAGVTLVPAVLSLLGPRVFWPSRRWREHPHGTRYRSIGAAIARRPGRIAAASGGILAALAVAAVFYTASYDSIGQLPTGAESRTGYETLRASFPAGSTAPTRVYVTAEQPLDRAELAELASEHARPDGVAAVSPPVYSADGRTARIDVVLADNPYSNEALDAVAGPIREAAHASGAGDLVLVGGQTAASADVRTATNHDLAIVFPAAALAIGLLLAWLLRSLVAPLYLMASVMLGFAATLGVTVVAFEGLLGEPGLKSILPVILYLFVVAVGTDYSILMTARLREEALRGHTQRAATALAVEHAGPAVAAAGIILAGTFTSLLLTGIASLMQIGLAVSSGILITSLVMATLLVPSLTALLGERAWWPGHRVQRGSRPGPGSTTDRDEGAATNDAA